MNVGKTLFAQVMEFVPWKTFGRIIERHCGDAGVRTLGVAPDPETYRQSIQQVVEAAGHSKASKSGAYLSTFSAMAKTERKRVSPQEAHKAVEQANGNKAHAAKALGVTRQALYRALVKHGA